uniref:MULE transposase domain-containing protein n=1 Tax=Strigamia maritima TaxID=126957 RepID=T1ITD8_STRMM
MAEKIYWKCENFRRPCSGRVMTNTNVIQPSILLAPSEHSHPPDGAHIGVIKVAAELKRRALTTMENPAQNLPTNNALRQVIKRARHDQLPKEPIDLDHLYFDTPFTETLTGEQFLAGAIDVDGKSLIFTTVQNLRHLCHASSILCDGTFKVVPRLFTQLFTLHVAIGGSDETKRILPVVYCLMERKTKESYIAVFARIKWLTEFYGLELDPDNIISDLKLVQLTLHKKFFLKLICKDVCFIYHKAYTDMFSKKTYYVLGKLRLNGTCSQPQFPPALWSVYTRQVNSQPRTTNAVESWHHHLQNL